MKRIAAILLALSLVATLLAGCGSAAAKGFEIALITDKGNIGQIL